MYFKTILSCETRLSLALNMGAPGMIFGGPRALNTEIKLSTAAEQTWHVHNKNPFFLLYSICISPTCKGERVPHIPKLLSHPGLSLTCQGNELVLNISFRVFCNSKMVPDGGGARGVCRCCVQPTMGGETASMQSPTVQSVTCSNTLKNWSSLEIAMKRPD